MVVSIKRGSRIIPARAGFTAAASLASTSSPDHPRSRGVYPAETGSDVPPGGSSPLARGLLQKLKFLQHPVDHPRSRGVYVMRQHRPWAHLGSSPLARGLLDRIAHGKDAARIIPARAGFTYSRMSELSTQGDHPRSRGVYRPPGRCPCLAPGSSPLARGLLAPHGTAGALPGIIPARAGFTRCHT